MDAASRSAPPQALLEMARRLGPRPYSERGPNPAPALPPTSGLVTWLVDAIDTWWVELGCPDPFTLVEIGAGDGTRAQAFLAAGPACLTALRYVLVEVDPVLRDRERSHLPIESPIFVLGPVGPGDGEDGDLDDEQHARALAGIGPLITSLPEPPSVDGDALVVALGWVSRLPSDRLEWRDGGWWEIRLAAGSEDEDELMELPIPLDKDRAAAVEQLLAGPEGPGPRPDSPGPRPEGPGPRPDSPSPRPDSPGPRPRPRPDGARYAVLKPAADWLAGALRTAGSGRLALVDRWTDLTRPLAPGEVPPLALDQLAAVRRPIEAAPVGLFPELSVVSWRLG